jgi:hypothetical protein
MDDKLFKCIADCYIKPINLALILLAGVAAGLLLAALAAGAGCDSTGGIQSENAPNIFGARYYFRCVTSENGVLTVVIMAIGGFFIGFVLAAGAVALFLLARCVLVCAGQMPPSFPRITPPTTGTVTTVAPGVGTVGGGANPLSCEDARHRLDAAEAVLDGAVAARNAGRVSLDQAEQRVNMGKAAVTAALAVLAATAVWNIAAFAAASAAVAAAGVVLAGLMATDALARASLAELDAQVIAAQAQVDTLMAIVISTCGTGGGKAAPGIVGRVLGGQLVPTG